MSIGNLAEKPPRKRNPRLTKNNQAAISLLDSWLEGDEKEQKETLDYLKKSLDEDRLSDRKLFK